MRIVKILGSAVLLLAALSLLCFSLFFLWSAIPREKPAPEVLDTDEIFLSQELPEPEPLPEPESEPEPLPEPEPEPLTPAETYLASMTLDEKLWQLFLVTPEAITGVNTATRAGDATKEALEACPVGGLCYFSANLEDTEQVQTMLQNTQSYAKTKLFLCIDEEGGSVSRAGSNENLAVTHFPSAAELGKAGDADRVQEIGATLAEELSALGFNVNFAPVADIVTNPENTEIGDRAYSTDPQIAADMVSAMVSGLEKNGMAACLKHFPGHGSTTVNSHEDRSVSARTPDELRQAEWLPFRAGIAANASFVMLSHLTNENLSALPASLSVEVVNLLRQELGFTGIVITDSHRMGAITEYYGSGEAAVLALQAGADMILMPADLQTAFDGVKAAVEDGTLSEERINESILRILNVKYDLGILEEQPPA